MVEVNRKRKNKLLYFLTMLVILIIFLVIFLFGRHIKDQIFIDSLPKQPINNIRSIVREEDNPKGNPFEYVYTTDKTYGNYIYMINQFPMQDEVGRKLEGAYKTFDFKLELDDNAAGINYVITLEKLAKSDLPNDWVKVYLENEGKGINNTFRNNGRVKTFNEYTQYKGKKNEIIMLKGTVTESEAKRGYKEFRLRMWISEDVKVYNEEYKGRTIVARVNVYASGNV